MAGPIILGIWLVGAMTLGCLFAFDGAKNPDEYRDPAIGIVILIWPMVVLVAILGSPIWIAQDLGARAFAKQSRTPPNASQIPGRSTKTTPKDNQ